MFRGLIEVQGRHENTRQRRRPAKRRIVEEQGVNGALSVPTERITSTLPPATLATRGNASPSR